MTVQQRAEEIYSEWCAESQKVARAAGYRFDPDRKSMMTICLEQANIEYRVDNGVAEWEDEFAVHNLAKGPVDIIFEFIALRWLWKWIP